LKKILTHKTLSLIVVFASVWSVPAYAAGPATGQLPQRQASAAASKQRFVGEVWNRTELYLGSQKADGSIVTRREFRHFVDEFVTPRFPDGLTVLTGYGQFRNSAGIIVKERSWVLILFYPPQMKDADKKIRAIRETYKHAFQQESVLRVDSLARVSF
jgi:hypothetical protein